MFFSRSQKQELSVSSQVLQAKIQEVLDIWYQGILELGEILLDKDEPHLYRKIFKDQTERMSHGNILCVLKGSYQSLKSFHAEYQKGDKTFDDFKQLNFHSGPRYIDYQSSDFFSTFGKDLSAYLDRREVESALILIKKANERFSELMTGYGTLSRLQHGMETFRKQAPH